MLPYSSIEFFIVAAFLVAVLYLAKALAGKTIPFHGMLMGLSLFYLLVYYPKPYHVLGFVAYSYILYIVINYLLKLRHKLIGSLLILLPMIMVKADVYHDLISFAGLSYISFRILQVYIDASPGDKPISFLRYMNFLIFTPTLLIGPIDRFARYNKDLDEGYNRLGSKALSAGWQLLVFGLLHKFILAEAVDRYWLSMADPESKALGDMANTMYAYFFFLYFDFAGYSAMAIGLGKMMGIDVPKNFDKPFLARNPQDFWQRFHISLGQWLRDYFFRPFYKEFSSMKLFRKTPLLRQNIALYLTFQLMGAWNGFQAHYLISGAMFGVYSVVHNSYAYYSRKKRKDIIFGKMNPAWVRIISIAIMFHMGALAIYVFSGRVPF